MYNLFDTTAPVMQYFNDNMPILIGAVGATIGVYRDQFPDDSKNQGVSVLSEITESLEYPNIMNTGLRINTRSRLKQNAFKLIHNVDLLLNLMVRKMITADVELVLSKRNSGPFPFEGQDGLFYYTALYETTMRTSDA